MRRTADRDIAGQSVLPGRTRSQTSDYFLFEEDYISSPLSRFSPSSAAMAEENRLLEEVERIEASVDYFADNFHEVQNWHLEYVKYFEDLKKRIKKVIKDGPHLTSRLKPYVEKLGEAKQSMDTAVLSLEATPVMADPVISDTNPSEAEQTTQVFSAQTDQQGEQPNAVLGSEHVAQSTPSHLPVHNPPPPLSQQAQLESNACSRTVRLESETADTYLDLDDELNLVLSLENVSKAIQPNSTANKALLDSTKLSIRQQNTLRLIRADLKSINNHFGAANKSLNERLASLGTLVRSLQDANNIATQTQLTERTDFLARLRRLEAKVFEGSTSCSTQQAPPPNTSTPNQSILVPRDGLTGSRQPLATERSHTSTSILELGPETTGNDALKQLIENQIKDLSEQLSIVLDIQMSDEISDSLLAECYGQKSRDLKKDIASLNATMGSYLKGNWQFDSVLVQRFFTV